MDQTLPHSDYEIIVINDGSTDLTAYALDLFSGPESIVKILTNETNKGLPASLNKGLRVAKAPYVVRVDSDDFVNRNFLNFLYYYMYSNDYADAVACDYLLLNDEEQEIARYNCDENPIACGIMFKKEQLFDIGLYDEEFLWNEERELRLRFEKKYNICRMDIPLYRYRRHSQNMTNNKEMLDRFNKNLINKHPPKENE